MKPLKSNRRVRKSIQAILILSIILIVTSVALSMLPTTYGLGQKVCLANHLVMTKAYELTHPLAEMDYKGNGSEGYNGTSSGAEHVPVLMYHYIVPKAYNPEPNNKSIIDLEAFELGMDFLYKEGYYTATLSELEDYVHGKIRLPEKTVVITFDDGYENNYTYAYPILKKYGFHAAIFLVGERVQEHTTEEFQPSVTTYFSLDQIKASNDVFEFHSHTHHLHYKKKAPCGKDYAATRDIDLLKEDIIEMERSGFNTSYIAYPYGDHNYQMIYQFVEDGYRMGFTVSQGFVKPGDHPMYLKRVTVASETSLPALMEKREF